MIKRIKTRIMRSRNPIKYWRALGAKIGERCEIYNSASLGSEPYLVTIGNHVRINGGVVFVTHDGGAWVLRDYLEDPCIDLFGQIQVGDNVHIGTNSIIMPGVRIGNNCVIGCSAVVTKDIPDNSVAVGVPARVIKSIDEYAQGKAHRFEYTKLLHPAEKKKYLVEKYGKLK